MAGQINRRQFIRRSAGITGGLAAAIYAGNGWAQSPSRSPNERLNLAAIGVGNKGKHNIDELRDQNWVAFCDVDENFLNQAATEFASAQKFRDYRQMFDKLGSEIDAVVVSTADHTHAPAAATALSLGKHVYCEKPLTHTVVEARTLAQLATKHRVATQMGIQIHADDNYRRVVELIQSKVIGKVHTVYTWCNKGWSDGRFEPGQHEIPATLDWDLWLGPAKQRAYSPNLHPANWRRFWQFGSGTFGDMACHVMDLPFWALNLRSPDHVTAEGPEVHEDGAPAWCRAIYDFPQADGSKIKLHWADGGTNFDFVKSTLDAEQKPLSDWGLGILFVGDQGMLAADYGRRQLLPADKFAGMAAPEANIPNSIGHWKEWIEAAKTGSPTTCNFDYASRLTETVLLGIVAYRSQASFVWQAEDLKAVGNDRAQALITKEYRQGFEVPGLIHV